ncbi:MAG: aminopeptidase P family protein [Clostridia bacterium]|nr:aminopeptidase P family protein [Clostridia bacterium]
MTVSIVKRITENLGQNEAALITSGDSRFYVTGFRSSAGSVVITKKKAYFLIDFRYFEKAKSVVKSCTVLLSNRSVDEIKEILLNDGVKKLFIETESASVSDLKSYREQISGVEISDDSMLDKLLEDMRCVKSEQEFELIKKAQKVTDDTFSYILNNIKAGRTEKEVMLDMEFYMRKHGGDAVAFDFIVISGKNTSLPHGVPTDKVIEDGDFVTMDFGASVGGYLSDMTRTVAVGHVSDKQKEVYNIVLKSQLEALKQIKAGVICKDIDKISRDIIYGAGYEGCFGHGLGHSVGIKIHENPNFNTRCTDILKAGTVITVEPGIYIENEFGVRIEDMVYVTDNGCIDITNSKKDLIVL